MGISVWNKLFHHNSLSTCILVLVELTAPLFCSLRVKQRFERHVPLRRSCRRRRPSHPGVQTPGQSPQPQARHRQERPRHRPVPIVARRRRCLRGAASADDAGRNPRKAEEGPRREAAALRRGQGQDLWRVGPFIARVVAGYGHCYAS